MKSKIWLLILGGILMVCLLLSVPLILPAEQAARAEIWSDGVLIETVDLHTDRVLTVENGSGVNTVTVEDGKIAVTAANCPDHYCMHRGFCSGGTQIVCLPNRLVIKFVGEQEIDSVVG